MSEMTAARLAEIQSLREKARSRGHIHQTQGELFGCAEWYEMSNAFHELTNSVTVISLLDHIDALELQVADWKATCEAGNAECDTLTAERDVLAERLGCAEAIVNAATAWDATLSEYCDGEHRDNLRTALAAWLAQEAHDAD